MWLIPNFTQGLPKLSDNSTTPSSSKTTFHNCVFKHTEFFRKTISVDEGHQSIHILDYELVYLASKSFKSCLSFNLLETISVWCSYWPGHRFDFEPLPVLGCRYLRWAGRYNVSISPQLRCHTPKLGSPCQSRPTPMDSTGSMQEGEEREILRFLWKLELAQICRIGFVGNSTISNNFSWGKDFSEVFFFFKICPLLLFSSLGILPAFVLAH